MNNFAHAETADVGDGLVEQQYAGFEEVLDVGAIAAQHLRYFVQRLVVQRGIGICAGVFLLGVLEELGERIGGGAQVGPDLLRILSDYGGVGLQVGQEALMLALDVLEGIREEFGYFRHIPAFFSEPTVNKSLIRLLATHFRRYFAPVIREDVLGERRRGAA